MPVKHFGAFWPLAWTIGGFCVSSTAVSAAEAEITFSKDIAPIIFSRCAVCHRPGEVAPFSLLSYGDVSKRARQIAEVTRRRYMPPWLPEPSSGELLFSGERRLTDAESESIERWVGKGAPEGDPADLPPLPTWSEGWQLGKPDLVLRMEEAFTVPPEGHDLFRKFVIPIDVPATRYVRAVEIRPGNPRVLHHAVVKIDRTGSVRQLDALDPGAGYGGMVFSEGESPDGHFIGWSPGRVAAGGSDDLAWRLDPGSDMVLQLHLQPNGRPEAIQVVIGLFFAPAPPSRIAFGLQLGSYTIDIPAGVKDYVVEDSYELPVDVDLLSLYPHAHYLCREVVAVAVFADGSKKSLIWIKNWDFNWQAEYRYNTPVRLPKGTRVTMRYTYDNSADNPRNPTVPPKRVVYGGHSTDEMGNLLFQVAPKSARDLAILREHFERRVTIRYIAAYRKMLETTADNAATHEALAACYVRIGDFRQAAIHAEASLRLRPDDPYVHYTLGLALSGEGELEAATRHFREALRVKPDYAEAHNNLGVMLQSLGRLGEAVEHYRQALQAAPEFDDAHNNLGNALASAGHVNEAIVHYRRALRANPDALGSLAGLAWILATHSDVRVRDAPEAIRLAERAAELTNQQHAVVLDTLAAAFAAAGEFERAIVTAEHAIALAVTGAPALVAQIQTRLERYRRRLPYIEQGQKTPSPKLQFGNEDRLHW
jgi:tetratricopeptide (TPR) repeat protein